MEFYFIVAFFLLGSSLNNVPVVGKLLSITSHFIKKSLPLIIFLHKICNNIEAYWASSGIVNVAEYQKFGVACRAGQALTINFARYFSENNWNCGADVTHRMRTLCPGSKCSFIQVTNSVLGVDPCFGKFKTLHIDYNCK